MVAAFLQLHHDVDESRDAPLHSLAQCFVVLAQNPPDNTVEPPIKDSPRRGHNTDIPSLQREAPNVHY